MRAFDFEREVTAERIRDKIAASKKKGKWMGSVSPLGYAGKDRTLVVNDTEAESVRMIFNLYLRLGSIRRVLAELDWMGLRTKHRPDLKGTARGGARFGRGRLQHLLTTPVYIGRVRQKEKTYNGAHPPIIAPAIWDAAQQLLVEHSAKASGQTSASAPSPFAGKVIDDTGDRLTPSHAKKGSRRYRYYVSHRLVAPTDETDASGWRLPADRLEKAVADVIAKRFEEPGFAMCILEAPTATEIGRIRRAASGLCINLRSDARNTILAKIVAGGSISPKALAIELQPLATSRLLQAPPDRINLSSLLIAEPWRIRRRGVETRLVIRGNDREFDPNLVSKVALASRLFAELRSGASIGAIAEREGLTRDRVLQIMRLAWLDPKLVAKIVSGTQPERSTLDAIFKSLHIAL